MDLVLHYADEYLLDSFYARFLPLAAVQHRYLQPAAAHVLPALNGSSIPTAFYSTAAAAAAGAGAATAAKGSSDSLSSSLLSALSTQWSHLITSPSFPYPSTPSANLSLPLDLSTISAWPRTYIPRQLLSLTLITMLGIHLMYFSCATFSYYFLFNKDMERHPRFLKNQKRKEIEASLKGFPWMMVLFLPFFQLEVMGYTRLYDDPREYGWFYFVFSIGWFLLFTDYCIYWIHRILHWPVIYKHIHKPHHKWIVPTPFASHAFHPIDGWSQGFPYHLFIFIFPMQHHLYLAMFIFVNIWTVLIHDSDMITGHPLENVINGPAHHTLHHLYFTVNYGQYFTWADRYYGSYKHPAKELDPMLEVQMGKRKEEREMGVEEEREKKRR